MNPFEKFPYAKPHEDNDFSSSEAVVYNYEKTKEKLKEIDELEAKRIAEIRATESDHSTITGKKIYVSTSGNDENDGLSEETPVKTLRRATHLVNYGDGMLLKRGDMWRESLACRSGVTYSAYGVGPKPFINASRENGAVPDKWTLIYEDKDTGALIWKYENEDFLDVGILVLNEGESFAHKYMPDFNGHFYKRGDPDKTPVTYKSMKNMEFFHKADSVFTTTDVNVIRCDAARGPIFFRCDQGNPGKVFDSIEFNERVNCIRINPDVRDVVIDNLCIKYSGFYGVSVYIKADNVVVKNCEIGWIGGSITSYEYEGPDRPVRLGNGVEIYGEIDGYYIDNCYIYQCYDAGVTHQISAQRQDVYQNNVAYTNNVITECVYSIEYFLSAFADDTHKRQGENILYENNICRRAGWGFGSTRPNKNCERHMRSGAGVRSKNAFYNYRIKNNIFDRCTQKVAETCTTVQECIPEYEGNIFIQGVGNELYANGNHTNPEIFMQENMGENSFENVRKQLGDTSAQVYFVPHIPTWEYSYTPKRSFPVTTEERAKYEAYLKNMPKSDIEVVKREAEIVASEEESAEIKEPYFVKTVNKNNLYTNIRGLTVYEQKDEKTGIKYAHMTVNNEPSVLNISTTDIPEIDLTKGYLYFKVLLRTNEMFGNIPRVSMETWMTIDGKNMGHIPLQSNRSQAPKANGEWEEIIIKVDKYALFADTPTEVKFYLFGFAPFVGENLYKDGKPLQADLYYDIAAWGAFRNLASAMSCDLMKEAQK